MNVLVVGTGKMGRAIAVELLQSTSMAIYLYDQNLAVSKKSYHELLTLFADAEERISIIDNEETLWELENLKSVILTIPCQAAENFIDIYLTKMISHSIPLISITRLSYDYLEQLQKRVDKRSQLVMLPFGLEPGLVEIICSAVAREIPNLTSIKTYCGGFIGEPMPPLNYNLLFGDYLPVDERDAWYTYKGIPSVTTRFSDLESIHLPELGMLEAYHDGMMPTTAHADQFRALKQFSQKTLRWPGYTHTVKTLRELGFFSKDTLIFQGHQIPINEITMQILKPSYHAAANAMDKTLVHIEISDTNDHVGTLTLVCSGDPILSSLARLTAITAVCAMHSITNDLHGMILPTDDRMLAIWPTLATKLRSLSSLTFTKMGLFETWL